MTPQQYELERGQLLTQGWSSAAARDEAMRKLEQAYRGVPAPAAAAPPPAAATVAPSLVQPLATTRTAVGATANNVAPTTAPASDPNPITAVTPNTFEPSRGAPSYYDSRYSTTVGTAKSQAEFDQQQAAYQNWLRTSGRMDPITGANLIAGPTAQPTQGTESRAATYRPDTNTFSDPQPTKTNPYPGTIELGDVPTDAGGARPVRPPVLGGGTGSGTNTGTNAGGGSPASDPAEWWRRAVASEVGRTPGATLAPDLSKINPENSLRTQQVMPTASPALQALRQRGSDLSLDLSRRQLPAFRGVGATDSGAAGGYEGESAAAARGASIGEFGPISPTQLEQAMAAVRKAQGEVDQAGPVDMKGIGAGSYSTTPAAQRARQIAQQSLEGMSGGPDRVQLALNAFNRFREEREPQFQQELRGVGQKAAALGRIGAGMTTNELTDVQTQRRRDEDRAERALIDDATAQQLADRDRVLSAALGAGGQFRGEDLDEAGFQQGLRQEERGERGMIADNAFRNAGLALERAGAREGQGRTLADFAGVQRRDAESDRGFNFNAAAERANLALRKSGALQGLASDRFGRESSLRDESRGERSAELDHSLAQAGLDSRGLDQLLATGSQFFDQEQGTRNEVRGERDFQDRLARYSVQDRINQALMEEQFTDSSFGRELDRLRLLRDIANIGYGGGQSEILLRAGNR